MKRLAPALVLTLALGCALPAQAETVDVKKAMEDRFIGKADAPVTINEYASLTCHHCASFHHNALPVVKKDLVETGKARLVFHDFPLDGFALKAAMMARCAPEDKYFPLLSVIFSNQERWTKAPDIDTSLAQLGALAGLDEDYAKSCMKNEELQKAIVAKMQDAQKAENIHETPSFRFTRGAEKMEEWDEFQDIFKANMVKHTD